MLYTDHDALRHLSSQGKVSSRHASWIAYLQQFTFVIKHTSGTSNSVANALSRRHTLLAVLHSSDPRFGSFVDIYPMDSFLGPLFKVSTEGRLSEYTIHYGFLFCGTQLCIRDCSLRLQLITVVIGRYIWSLLRTSDLLFVVMWKGLFKDVLFASSPRVTLLMQDCICLCWFRRSHGRTLAWNFSWVFHEHIEVLNQSLLWLIVSPRSTNVLQVASLSFREIYRLHG